jgi:hypothetical protein
MVCFVQSQLLRLKPVRRNARRVFALWRRRERRFGKRVGWAWLFAIPISREGPLVMGFASGTSPAGRSRWLYPILRVLT